MTDRLGGAFLLLLLQCFEYVELTLVYLQVLSEKSCIDYLWCC